MLEPIERRDLPARRGGKSPARIFAEETILAFLDAYGPGQVAEVTGWPADEGRDAVWNASKARNEIRRVLFYGERRNPRYGSVKVSRCGARVFMEMEEA